MAKDKNQYGQYMTPDIITNFMVELITHDKNCSILEPSSGNGAFIDALLKHNYSNITAYEIDNEIINPQHSVINKSFVSAEINNRFDVVIGNPPYIRWKNLEDELKDELGQSELWNTYCNSLCDYSNIFILKAIESLKENGELIFITPEYWMTTTHAVNLRNNMLEEGYIESIYHFNETPIFKDVNVSLVIFKFVKSKKDKKNLKVVKFYSKKKINLEDIDNIKSKNSSDVEYFEIPQYKKNASWILADENTQNLIEKYEKNCIKKSELNFGESDRNYEKIGDYFDIGNGMVSGLDKAFQIPIDTSLNEREIESSIDVVKAKDLNGYYYVGKTKYIFITDPITPNIFKNKYPTYFSLLQNFKGKLAKRYNYGRSIAYWEWVFLRNYNLFNKPQDRLFVPCKERITKKSSFRFTYIPKGIYPTQDVIALFKKDFVKEDLLYVMALLNSSYVFKWLSFKGIRKGDIVEFSEKPLSAIPYRTIDFSNNSEKIIHDRIVSEMKEYLQSKNSEKIKIISDLLDKLME